MIGSILALILYSLLLWLSGYCFGTDHPVAAFLMLLLVALPRAVVAAIMGYEYVGFDIRQEQIDENFKLLEEMGLEGSVDYYLGDGCLLSPAFDMGKFDMALTCPPYWNLEKYSDLPNDLSNLKTYRDFDNCHGEMC